MAKGIKTPYVHVSKNVKTPAQKAKAAANAVAAEQRLRNLRQIQADVKLGRAAGFTGLTDEIVAMKYRSHLAEQANMAQEAALRAEVDDIIAACSTDGRRRLLKWLAERIDKNAAFVLAKINEFMSRARNKDVKDYVDHVFAQRVIKMAEKQAEAAA